MSNVSQEIRRQLTHTWPLFFTRHGNFTETQRQAIPSILAGQDTLLVAATASGKTEAVIAPVVERLWHSLSTGNSLSLLYICPMRALVRDLYGRLATAFADTSIEVAMKTGDTGALRQNKPPNILITTPESADSLLTSRARIFATVQAIVIDEIHLFDNSPRGDHLRCLLNRIERIRSYADPATEPMQRILLSATVPEPEGLANRYLRNPRIVTIAGGRKLNAEVAPLYDLAELTARMKARSARKTLVFCNTRDEVEQIAAYLRDHLAHDAQIFVHYGILDGKLRKEVEERFAAAAVAVCVSTSTLELGIDIGSVDDVVLVGAPHNLNSFLQRVGRGGRRSNEMRVLCMPKTPLEWIRFESLLQLATGAVTVSQSDDYQFRPSVLVQQIFSLIKQNPSGSIRLGDVRRIAPAEITSDAIQKIVAELTMTDYLRTGRVGEWRAGRLLQELFDVHEIYSNIGATLQAVAVVDAYTNRILAHTEKPYAKGSVVLFGGRPMKVVWQEQRRFGLAPARGQTADEVLRFAKSYAAIPFDVANAVSTRLGLSEHELLLVPAENGAWLVHCWGTVWGELLARLLVQLGGVSAETHNEYVLHLRPTLSSLPEWHPQAARKVAIQTAVAMAERLQMGRFHTLLPASVATEAAVQQLNMAAFEQRYKRAQLIHTRLSSPLLDRLLQ